MYREPRMIQVQTPGSKDVIVLEQDGRTAGKMEGIRHFGFRLKDSDGIKAAANTIRDVGGQGSRKWRIRSRVEPYFFAHDLDGYRIEI